MTIGGGPLTRIVRRPERPARPLALRLPEARPLTLVLEVVAGTLLLALVLLGGLHLKLSYGPIDAGFLVQPIEAAINTEIAPLRADISGAVIRYEEGARDVRFRLEGVVIRGEDGSVVARAPAAGISLSAHALLTGRIAPSSIDLIRPRLQLNYTDASGLTLSTPGTGEKAAAKPAILSELPEVDTDTIVAGTAQGAPAKTEGFRISLAETISATLADARKRTSASSYLTGLGLVDAEVLLDTEQGVSRWRLPRLTIELEHREKRSLITGAGQISTLSGPVAFGFSAEESEKEKQLRLTTRVSNLVPKDIAESLTGFGALASLAMPVSGESTMALSTSGELKDVETTLDLGAGAFAIPSLGVEPISLDDGKLRLRYVSDEGRIEILPSLLRAGQSRATVSGMAVPRKAGGSVNLWEFNVDLTDVKVADATTGLAAAPVEGWTIRGAFVPRSSLLTVERMHLTAGGGTLDLAGRASSTMGLGLRGVVTAMPVDIFKRLWPRAVAPPARAWVMENVAGGTIAEGHLVINLDPAGLKALDESGVAPVGSIEAGLAAEQVAIGHVPGLPPIEAARASLTLKDNDFAAELPDGVVKLASGKEIAVSDGTFTIVATHSARPMATAEFKTVGDVDGALELLSEPRLALAQKSGFHPGDITGNLKGSYRFEFPLLNDLAFADIKTTGNARIEEMGAGKALGPFALQGGTLDLVVTEKALEASGKILVDGVSAEIGWSRPFDGGASSPLKLSAVLDAADREQLGLSVNHFMIGDVPITLALGTAGATPEQIIDVTADLTPVELVLDNMAWRKPPGQEAKLTFRVVPREGGGADLKDVRIQGDGIDIAGHIVLDKERKLAAFEFPEFSMNFLSRLAITGKVERDVWKVKASGTTYDGRTLFRSFFSAGEITDTAVPESKSRTGIDLTASIDTIVGYEETTVRNVDVKLSRRDGKLQTLTASGTLPSGKPVSVRLAKGGGGRKLLAETKDAGNAFRLIGFYSNVEGGDAALEVNLDGQGAAEKTGTLWTREFQLLGDTVVKTVLSRAPETAGDVASKSVKPERQRLYFNKLRVPFSVGSGQLIVHDSYINGPAMGATLRGRVDFNRDYVQLSGTYVPLYGINSVLGEVPILGDILTGGNGGGILGITFSVQGRLKDPQVGVNPVSALTPGIFRQIFESDPSAGGIQKRAPVKDGNAAAPTTSSLPPQTAGSAASVGEAMEAQTAPSAKKPKTGSDPAWEAESN